MTQSSTQLLMRTATCLLLAIGFTATAMGIQPQQWVDQTEADFNKGKTEGTVITNLGDLELAADLSVVGEMPEDVSIIYDMVMLSDGTLYLAAGPEGKLLRKQDDKLQTLASFEAEQIFTLHEFNGELMVGISSADDTRLAVLRDDELVTVASLPDTRYIWDITTPTGWDHVQNPFVVVATGTEGTLLLVTLTDEPTIETIMQAKQTNLLCLAAAPNGSLYIGTDTDGLIYRLRPKNDGTFDEFVIYDAAEPEIATLVVSSNGVVYAGTADAEKARPGRMASPRDETAGRRESDSHSAGLDDDAPEQDMPAPEDIPGVPPSPDDIDTPADDTPLDAAQDVEQATDIQESAPADTQATGAATAASGTTSQVTSEQRDRLRELVKARLDAARESGDMSLPAAQSRESDTRTSAAAAARPRPAQTPSSREQGNAIYRIDPEGFVHEIFRESVMILQLALLDNGRTLIATTGNEGQIYRIRPQMDETSVLAKLEGQQIPALLVMPGKHEDRDRKRETLIFGTANPAQLVYLTDQIASEGTYVSQVFDAKQISLFGSLNFVAKIPSQTKVTVQTRSGNVQDPEQAPWSDWTDANVFEPTPDRSDLFPRPMRIESPPARFLQYRLQLEGDGQRTPAVNRVDMTYVMPNLRPSIQSIRATYSEPRSGSQTADELPTPATRMPIQWQASDPNDDRLIYKLEYRPAESERWLLMTDELMQTSFDWETRRVPDGWYVIRLTASDRLDNPSDMALTSTRLSDPVLVDNTPPRFRDVRHVQTGNGTIQITGTVTDELSQIAGIAYVLNDSKTYEQILPDDLIFDSTRESWRVTISDLSTGSHVVTLRAVDRRGNVAYHAIMLQVD